MFKSNLFLFPENPSAEDADPLFQSAPARGKCRVICFHPWSDLSLPEMEVTDIRHVVDTWVKENIELGKTLKWVQVRTTFFLGYC